MSRRQNYNTRDGDGLTPIFYAVLQDELESAELLIRNGANVNIKTRDGETPLMWACAFGNEDMAALLIEGGANIMVRDKNNGTVLSWACIGGAPGVVRLMLQNGLDPNARDKMGHTPLILACHGHHPDIVVSLVEEGRADVNQTGADRITPLMSASMHGHTDICELLLYYDADFNLQDTRGRTALMWACRAPGSAPAARLLLNMGANPLVEDAQSHRAIDYLAPLAQKHGGRLRVLQRELTLYMKMYEENGGGNQIFDALEYGDALVDDNIELIGPNVRALDVNNADDRRVISRGRWFYDARDVRRDGSLIRAFEADVLARMAAAGAVARNPLTAAAWPIDEPRQLRRVLKKLRT